jgi:hypothetical protein
MASGHVNRTQRPNTWLHRPSLQNVKKALANSEPSTHDPKAGVWRKVVTYPNLTMCSSPGNVDIPVGCEVSPDL